MELKFIESIINAVDKSSLDYFEIETDGESPMKLKLGRNIGQLPMQNGYSHENGSGNISSSQTVQKSSGIEDKADVEMVKSSNSKPKSGSKTEISAEEELYEVKAPIVGVFYSASGPNKPPFVKVGDTVKKGQTLCIIEAMKVMNEIESARDGEIVEIKCKDQEMVEFDQVLFTIR